MYSVVIIRVHVNLTANIEHHKIDKEATKRCPTSTTSYRLKCVLLAQRVIVSMLKKYVNKTFSSTRMHNNFFS